MENKEKIPYICRGYDFAENSTGSPERLPELINEVSKVTKYEESPFFPIYLKWIVGILD